MAIDDSGQVSQGERMEATRAVVAAILSVLLIFIAIQVIGTPIIGVRNVGYSILYSVLAFLPVLTICMLAEVQVKENR